MPSHQYHIVDAGGLLFNISSVSMISGVSFLCGRTASTFS